jgi:hypothetical protein
MTRRELVGLLPPVLLPWVIAAQARYADGVFVHDCERPIELLAYAERGSAGQLRLIAASFDDVPTLSRIHRVLCSEPFWKPTGVWASTMAAFEDDRAERRQLRFGTRQLNIYAMELKIPDVESLEGVARLAQQVRAAAANPLLVFVTMRSDRTLREYVIQLATRDA